MTFRWPTDFLAAHQYGPGEEIDLLDRDVTIQQHPRGELHIVPAPSPSLFLAGRELLQ